MFDLKAESGYIYITPWCSDRRDLTICQIDSLISSLELAKEQALALKRMHDEKRHVFERNMKTVRVHMDQNDKIQAIKLFRKSWEDHDPNNSRMGLWEAKTIIEALMPKT